MEKTKLMEESMKQLDEEMRRSDELLSQMIPKQVAEKVKSGANPVDTCEVRWRGCAVSRNWSCPVKHTWKKIYPTQTENERRPIFFVIGVVNAN